MEVACLVRNILVLDEFNEDNLNFGVEELKETKCEESKEDAMSKANEANVEGWFKAGGTLLMVEETMRSRPTSFQPYTGPRPMVYSLRPMAYSCKS